MARRSSGWRRSVKDNIKGRQDNNSLIKDTAHWYAMVVGYNH